MRASAKALAGFAYDQRLASVYDEGQAMLPETRELWLQRFEHHAGQRRPQSVLDLGCGTGAFAPALAEAFGGPVFAVEPSDHMRAVAECSRPHPQVSYLRGRAEDIPLPSDRCDLALMYLVLQHVADRAAAAREVYRILKADGRLLIAGRFRGEPTPRAWSRYFPKANAIEEASLPTVEETRALFADASLELLASDRIRFVVCRDHRDYLERLSLRPISSFQHLSDEEFVAGIAALKADVARELPGPVEQEANLLVFRRT